MKKLLLISLTIVTSMIIISCSEEKFDEEEALDEIIESNENGSILKSKEVENSDVTTVDNLNLNSEKYDIEKTIDDDIELEEFTTEESDNLITVSGIMAGVYEDGSGEYIIDANDQNAAGKGYSLGIFLSDSIEINNEKVDFLLFVTSDDEWKIDFSQVRIGDKLTITGIIDKHKTTIPGGKFYSIDVKE